MKSTVFKSESNSSGSCVQCHSETENITIVFGAWICSEKCENKVIDKYLDVIQERIRRFEESIGEDENSYN